MPIRPSLRHLTAGCLALSSKASAPTWELATAPAPFTVISMVAEANARVVALSPEFGQELPLNWGLAQAFSVKAELLQVKAYVGDLIGNSLAGKAPRRITRANTNATTQPDSPVQARQVIIERRQDNFNASSW